MHVYSKCLTQSPSVRGSIAFNLTGHLLVWNSTLGWGPSPLVPRACPYPVVMWVMPQSSPSQPGLDSNNREKIWSSLACVLLVYFLLSIMKENNILLILWRCPLSACRIWAPAGRWQHLSYPVIIVLCYTLFALLWYPTMMSCMNCLPYRQTMDAVKWPFQAPKTWS